MNDIVTKPRTCGECHKCCEGWLFGVAHTKEFYPGTPCHYLALGKGCSIYDQRPEDPCKSYKCEWLINDELPEWFRPDLTNVIVTKRKLKNHIYWDIIECGKSIEATTLNWLILHTMHDKINIVYRVNSGLNYLGSTEFVKDFQES